MRKRTKLIRLAVFLFLLGLFNVHGFSQSDEENPNIMSENTLPNLSRRKIITENRFLEVASDVQGVALRGTWEYKHDYKITFLRLHVRAVNLPADNSWSLQIKDSNGRLIDTLTKDSFFKNPKLNTDSNELEAWSKLVWDTETSVELRSKTPPCVEGNPDSLCVEIDQVNYSFLRPASQAITTKKNDMRDLIDAYRKDHKYYRYSQPTAIIFFLTDKVKNESNCTGFLLTPTLLVTNNHCISQLWQTKSAEVRFGYETGSVKTNTAQISKIEMTNPQLDFSLLRLASMSNPQPIAKIELKPVTEDQQLVLIEYPNARTKTISLIGCVVQYTDAGNEGQGQNDFYHLCDTEGGASGSPVFDEKTGRVVGIHHLGIPRENNEGRNLAVKITSVMSKIEQMSKIKLEYKKLFDEIKQYQ